MRDSLGNISTQFINGRLCIFSEACPRFFSIGADFIFKGGRNIFIRGRVIPYWEKMFCSHL